LNVIRVEGGVFGHVGRKFTFHIPTTGGENRLDPIGFRVLDTGEDELEVRREEDRIEITSNGRDFIFRYDVVLTIEDRYSPEVRDMLTEMGDSRSRFMGRDLFLLPGLALAGGIVIDVDPSLGNGLAAAHETVGRRVVVPSSDLLSQILIVTGDYRYIEETIGGADMVLAIGGEWKFTDEELFGVIRDVVTIETGMFGSSHHDRHLFVCDYNPVRGAGGFDYYGIHFSGGIFLFLDPAMDSSDLFDRPMSVVAHEFFHNWNGEAFKPEGDSLMWFTEGVTVYYSYKVLLEARIISRQRYDAIVGSIRDRYLANRYQGDMPLSRAGNNDLGDKEMVNLLYDGGMLAALELDKRISEVTGGRAGLIDVLRLIYERSEIGAVVGEKEIAAAAEEISGEDLVDFIRELVHDPSPAVLCDDLSS
jgi:hypothetical protein